MGTTPTTIALPQNPAGITGQPVQNNSFYKAFKQLVQQVNASTLGQQSNDVTSSRTYGTPYTATKVIYVAITGELNLGVGHTATIQGVVTPSGGSPIKAATDTISNGSGMCFIGFTVPSGATYQVNTGGIGPGDSDSATLYAWIES